MRTLPNDITVFNATAHTIRFWKPGWDRSFKAPPDEIINVKTISEQKVSGPTDKARFVHTQFLPTAEGDEIIRHAYQAGAHVIVGSIIAAQAYPGHVAAVIACKGYEQVPQAKKRVRPDKFTIF